MLTPLKQNPTIIALRFNTHVIIDSTHGNQSLQERHITSVQLTPCQALTSTTRRNSCIKKHTQAKGFKDINLCQLRITDRKLRNSLQAIIKSVAS